MLSLKNRALVEAAETFEAIAEIIDPALPDGTEIEMRIRGVPVYYLALGTLRDFRRAAEALALRAPPTTPTLTEERGDHE
jgi:hypothetical protein